jgi:hypothetical protein
MPGTSFPNSPRAPDRTAAIRGGCPAARPALIAAATPGPRSAAARSRTRRADASRFPRSSSCGWLPRAGGRAAGCGSRSCRSGALEHRAAFVRWRSRPLSSLPGSIYGCPIDLPLAIGLCPSPCSCSMRSWESACLGANRRQTFPRSHEPGEGRLGPKGVDFRLMSRCAGFRWPSPRRLAFGRSRRGSTGQPRARPGNPPLP